MSREFELNVAEGGQAFNVTVNPSGEYRGILHAIPIDTQVIQTDLGTDSLFTYKVKVEPNEGRAKFYRRTSNSRLGVVSQVLFLAEKLI